MKQQDLLAFEILIHYYYHMKCYEDNYGYCINNRKIWFRLLI